MTVKEMEPVTVHAHRPFSSCRKFLRTLTAGGAAAGINRRGKDDGNFLDHRNSGVVRR